MKFCEGGDLDVYRLDGNMDTDTDGDKVAVVSGKPFQIL